jgi:hypothetical protein
MTDENLSDLAFRMRESFGAGVDAGVALAKACDDSPPPVRRVTLSEAWLAVKETRAQGAAFINELAVHARQRGMPAATAEALEGTADALRTRALVVNLPEEVP